MCRLIGAVAIGKSKGGTHQTPEIRGKHDAADGSVLARVFFCSIQPEVILTEIG